MLRAVVMGQANWLDSHLTQLDQFWPGLFIKLEVAEPTKLKTCFDALDSYVSKYNLF